MNEAFAAHLQAPHAIGYTPVDACTGAAGGAACGDLIRISVAVDEQDPHGRICDIGFDASGCGAAVAAGSATVALIDGKSLLDAARIGACEIAAELGGLSPAKMHAAELAADALHRALGLAAKGRVALAAAPGRVVVAMSGGVDSAVAALLATYAAGGGAGQAAGSPAESIAGDGVDSRAESIAGDGAGSIGAPAADVVAVTLELWADPQNDGQRSCCSAEAVRGARALAHSLGLPHLSLDLRQEFRAGVVEPWLADHAAGRTPYPCVRCNGFVRLDGMLAVAKRLGADALVTGHYARVRAGEDGLPLLRVAADHEKDQSYALAALSRASLARMRFPLGELRKEQVRELARRAALTVARRPDSQDLCFLAGTTPRAFLARHGSLAERPGAILARDGRSLGVHRGAHAYTVGQRHGLGISGAGEPLHVLATDTDANTVTVGPRAALRTQEVRLRDVVLHGCGDEIDSVKINYRGARLPCELDSRPPAGAHPELHVCMRHPIERTAPGQLACLYSGDVVVGHGTIVG